MEARNYVTGLIAESDYPQAKVRLQSSPLCLEVREDGNLFTLMTTAASRGDDALLRQFAGPIFEKSSGKLVGYGLDRADQIQVDTNCNDQGELNSLFCAMSCQDVFQYVEGVKLTVYRHNGAWLISTTRMINAFKSFWSTSKSFGTLFMDACAVLYPALFSQLHSGTEEGPLETSFSYVFVLASPDHKIVRLNDNPSVIHVGTYDLNRLRACSHNIGIATPVRVPIVSAKDLQTALDTSTNLHPGFLVICKQPTGRLVRVRVLTTRYKEILDLRGNTPDDLRHYLEVRHDKRKSDTLKEYYPEFRTIGCQAEDAISNLSSDVHRLYVSIFVRKMIRPKLSQNLQHTLQQIHHGYLTTRLKRTPENVYTFISNLPVVQLYRLLTKL